MCIYVYIYIYIYICVYIYIYIYIISFYSAELYSIVETNKREQESLRNLAELYFNVEQLAR